MRGDGFGLVGNFAPVRRETTSGALPVTGGLPRFLDGVYVRNGPNPISDPDPHSYNWFVADGMVHGVRLRNGHAEWYRNRYVRSGHVCEVRGVPAPPAGAMDTRLGPNTNVVRHAGRNLVLTEGGPAPFEISDELETVGPCDFGGTLDGAYSAHPRVDPRTGELHALSYFWRWNRHVRYTVTNSTGVTTTEVRVPVPGRPMIHDFALTDNYAVVLDLPVTYSARNLGRAHGTGSRAPDVGLPGATGRRPLAVEAPAAAFPYAWNDGYAARVGLLDRRPPVTGSVRWFDVEQCFVFHMLNAHEDGDKVVVDVVRRDRAFVTGADDSTPFLERWTLGLTSGAVTRTRLDDRAQEFPRINDSLAGSAHRFGYLVAVEGAGGRSVRNAVVKQDVVSGGSVVHALDPGDEPSEFCFVPDPEGSDEDDGVLLGYVFVASTGLTDLVVLAAQTMEQLARVHLPVRVPHGFHGNWLESRIPEPVR